ncbi:S-(hydroxymethyl)glutathione dehydrogenase / alcohol dehydrogenase [Microlunatus sagamiharensis]|uniref:S-(Hydroxymethyl)glutathione dehydrogenase / alcohol dehydrogenase n=1 Tax=Microlunatus sagamiharensis TaxID=546874 RepID=A0A1H2LF59_9ACTN|nr:zinc-binding dehydrogenase [Microlunatus sagamiharensis]SDU79660.1 S-(hydroxymethyl)glutathione dehydrogenase / alcohol dehydrogenase [Microlunatus sagamiharensis]
MLAAVLRETGAPLSMEQVELDEPGPGEVRVRIEAAGVCHSDLHYVLGDLPARLPLVVGHEGAGVVEALGPRTTGRISVGDRVALQWRPRCGECDACVAGNPVLCRYGRVLATTNGLMDGTSRLHAGGETLHHLMGVSCFAEQAVVSETSVLAIPDEVPTEVAAISACAVITGVGAVLNAVEDAAGRPLLVLGAGGVGLAAVMGAALVGAGPVIAVDVDPGHLELASAVGATHVVDAREGDVVERVLALTGGAGVPWAVDAVGAPATMRQCVDALSPGGTLVAVGLNRPDATMALPINDLVQRQKRVVGALYGASNPRMDLPRLFSLYAAGRLPLDRLLGDRRPLAEADAALASLRGGAAGRTVLVP